MHLRGNIILYQRATAGIEKGRGGLGVVEEEPIMGTGGGGEDLTKNEIKYCANKQFRFLV